MLFHVCLCLFSVLQATLKVVIQTIVVHICIIHTSCLTTFQTLGVVHSSFRISHSSHLQSSQTSCLHFSFIMAHRVTILSSMCAFARLISLALNHWLCSYGLWFKVSGIGFVHADYIFYIVSIIIFNVNEIIQENQNQC